jgi:putative SOS response-associated peptidase YedK
MCGRFTLAANPEGLAESFPGVDFSSLGSSSGSSPGPGPSPGASSAPRYNIAPSQPVAAILNRDPARAVSLRWGLVPHWAKDPSLGNRMINARAETLAERPSFREPLRKRRCLVPADGFYEWRQDGAGRAGKRPRKVPMYVKLKSGAPFAFAGLWDTWHPGKEEVASCAVITTEANQLLSGIHDRMPVIIPPERYSDWLDPGERRPETLEDMLRPYPAGAMTAYPVSPRVNDPRVDDPGCIEPVGDP